jgi:hypothetical protein
LVFRSTAPPVKFPGRSGVNVLVVTIASTRSLGNISRFTARRSGSALGTSTPLTIVEL